MSIPEIQYCTCPHLSGSLVLQAAKILTKDREEHVQTGRPKKKIKLADITENTDYEDSDPLFPNSTFACAHCDFTGNKGDESFMSHFLACTGTSGHVVAVDLTHRELFCMQCRDYQYHHQFDNLIKHCRPGKDFMHQRRKIPLGIVNMGSTCFMSSVLQLLVASPALVRFFEISECFVVKCKINEVERLAGKTMLCIFCELQKVFLRTNSTSSR